MHAQLPRIDIEALFRKVCCDDCSPRELATSKSLDRALCRLNVLVLDIDLSITDAGASACGARDLGLNDRAVLLALFFHVFLDF